VDNKKLYLSLIFTIIALVGLMQGSVLAQTPAESMFFPETGHWVVNEFWEKYTSVPNGRELFGLPITEQFLDQASGLYVQYFEKTRFELHPDEIPDLRVQLSPIGLYLYTPGEKLTIPPNFPSCRYFRETGHQVCYAFLDFFEDNGGTAQFGYPISDFEIHDGWISQYFQRARFEWHPENNQGERVVLADLGVSYFEFKHEDRRLLQPNLEEDNIPKTPVSSLQVHAFVSKPVLPLENSEQKLYVIVYDQYFNPVENAIISYVIHLPTGEDVKGNLEVTDANGLSAKDIQFSTLKSGTATITVTITYLTLQEQTQTSFQLW
jgi:hypothetical protein